MNAESNDAAPFAHFQSELGRLVEQFGRNLKQYKSHAYDEASLRQEFLDPLFRALGWDVENKTGTLRMRGSQLGSMPPEAIKFFDAAIEVIKNYLATERDGSTGK